MASVRKRKWKRKDGSVSFGWICQWNEENGKPRRKLFRTKREADSFRIEIESQLQTGGYRSLARELTVSDVAAKYLVYCEERMKRGERMTRHNLATYKGHIHKHILDPEIGIGGYKLSEISPAQVSAFRDRLRDNNVSVPTTRKILATLHASFEFAAEHDFIARNPARNIRVIGNRAEQSRKIFAPSNANVMGIIDAATEVVARKIIVAATTGIRAGELHALRWRHIDMLKGELRIETRVDAYRSEDVTKTAAGMRTIPVSDDVMKQLREWRLQSSFSSDDDLIFPNKKGNYENHDNMVKRQFKPLFDLLRRRYEADPTNNPEPPEYFNWHALRHFAISCWIEAGLAPKTVQTFAGHSSLQVTMDRYGHLFPSEEHQQAMNAIASKLLSS